jgi:hypothetical protein
MALPADRKPKSRPDPEPQEPCDPAERLALLEQSAIDLGLRWAKQQRQELHREGRPAAGGWPGTLREARTRVEQDILPKVARRVMAPVTREERERAARTAYASARSEWRRNLEPEAP